MVYTGRRGKHSAVFALVTNKIVKSWHQMGRWIQQLLRLCCKHNLPGHRCPLIQCLFHFSIYPNLSFQMITRSGTAAESFYHYHSAMAVTVNKKMIAMRFRRNRERWTLPNLEEGAENWSFRLCTQTALPKSVTRSQNEYVSEAFLIEMQRIL